MVYFCLFLTFNTVCQCSACECEIYDDQTNSLTKFCENCSANELKCQPTVPIESYKIHELKVIGCDNQTVSWAIETYASLRHLDLSNSAFKSLKWLSLKQNHLQLLNLSHNALPFLPWGLMEHTPELRTLDLSHNILTHLDSKRLFDGAKKLQKLYLAHNALHSINYETFSSVPQLQFIDLTGNRFTKVPIFPKNPALSVLCLRENPIATFVCFHTKMMVTGVVSVHLNWQNISAFYGNSYCDSKRMRIIFNRDRHGEGVFVTSNGTYQLHCNAKSFTNLRHLIAGRNAFENIDEFIRCFGSSVWHLNFSGNRMRSPQNIASKRFNTLRTLFLSDTALTRFDFKWLVKLKNLTKFDVSNNNLTRFENVDALQGLENLLEFNVAGNHIANLMDVINNLTFAVEKLNVAGNFIGKLISTELFGRFTAARKLNLSDTSLKIDALNPFLELTALQSLDISNNNYLATVNFTVLSTTLNQLTEFRAANCQLRAISDVLKLLGMSVEILDLSHNPIKTLNAHSFEHLIQLQTLHLRNCSLTYFDAAVVKNQLDLRALDVSQNHIQTINLKRLPSDIRHLNIEANELWKMENFFTYRFPALRTMAVAKNQFSCEFLIQLKQWPNLVLIGDPFKQKHGQQCHLDAIHVAVAIIMFGIFVIVAFYFGLQLML